MSPKHRKRAEPVLPMDIPDGIAPPVPDVVVNPGVDTLWELVENEALSMAAAGGNYGVRALAKGSHNPTERFLNKLRHDRDEFGALLAAVKGLCHSDRKDHWRFCEKGRGAGKGLFEFKRTRMEFRLFFFYAEDVGLEGGLVICVDGFTKTKTSPKEQNRKFEKAARIRDEYLSQRRPS